MNIYTIYSGSHKEMFRLLRDSLSVCKDYTLYARPATQHSKTGDYDEDDFVLAIKDKLEFILEILDRENEPFLFTDVDIYVFRDFIKDLKSRLNGYDFVVQYEKRLFGFLDTVCAGFIYMKPNKRVKKMYRWILKHIEKLKDDQNGINRYKLSHRTNYNFLPKEYYQINYDNSDKVWNGENIKPSVNPFIFHYHWTIGYENKMKLLEMVKKQVCVN